MTLTERMTGNRAMGPTDGRSPACRAGGSLWRSTALALVLAAMGAPQAGMAQEVVTEGDVAPGGATSPDWNVGGELSVGNTREGSLTISDGGTVTNTIGAIGYNVGSSGTVTVSGENASWDNSSFVNVGGRGTGGLTISDGGTVTNTRGSIGAFSSSSGTVTVSGAGSSWDNSGSLQVGAEGTGELTISDGGTVTSDSGAIGVFGGSSGTVTVSGAGSSWDNSGSLQVGAEGTGELTISDGGTVISDAGFIGGSSDGIGTLTVSGENASWDNSGFVNVGHDGTGELTISDGGAVTNTNGYIGRYVGSSGTVTVLGAGSSWDNSGSLQVGAEGTGELTISDGGTVTSDAGFIGDGSDGIGTVTVSGENASWNSSGSVNVGSSSTGGLTISDGGTVTSDAGYIGGGSDGIGTVTVSGENASWQNERRLFVGFDGTGALTIEEGGTVANTAGHIGVNDGSEGEVLVTGEGSQWANTGSVNVGASGTGALTISDGGTVTSDAAFIGASSGSSGTVTVSGADSSWDNAGSVTVGADGTGALTISDGGTVTSEGALIVGSTSEGSLTITEGGTVTNTNGVIGAISGSSGTVTVSGENASWDNSGSVNVGASGTGGLTISDGGTVTSDAGFIGSSSGSSGTVTVSGENASWGNSGNLTVGVGGTGTLTISGGGVVNVAGRASIANRQGTSSATVEGNGSHWNITGDLLVGRGHGGAAYGTLTISDGGLVTPGATYLGVDRPEASGEIALNSNGVLATGLVAKGEGSGTLSVDGGILRATSDEADFLRNFDAGDVTLDAGGAVFDTNGFDIGIATGLQGTGGLTKAGTGMLTLTGESHYSGDTTVDEGTLTISDGGHVTNSHGFIGRNDGSSGTVKVSGAGSSWTNSGAVDVGAVGTGELTISDGGTATVDGVARIAGTSSATGTLNIGAAAGEAAAAAGSLSATGVVFGAGRGTLVFNHTGNPDGSAHAFDTALSGAGAIDHLAGETRLTGDSSGFSGTMRVSGGTLVISRVLGVNQDDAAEVTGGELRVDGVLGFDARVDGGGILSGDGTVAGDAVINGGGVLAGTQGQKLVIGRDLVLDQDAVVDVALGGATTDALFQVDRDLTLDGTLNISDQGGFGAGIYRLIDYDGELTDNGMTVGTVPGGVDADTLLVQTAEANQVNLVSSFGAELGFWDGGNTALHDNGAIDGGSGTWRADGRNWTQSDGALNGPFQPNPTFAVLQGEAGTVTVDDDAEAIGATGMQFATDGYRIEGDAIALEGAGGESIIRVGDGTAAGADMTATIASNLTGNTRLVTSDLGTLVLAGANTYTGGTALRSGTLSVSSNANLGDASGDLVFTGGALATTASFDTDRSVAFDETGRLDVAAGTTLGLSGALTGTADLFKAGEGTLTLTGTNAYGDTLVAAGTLIGETSSISGSIANAGTVVFDQGGEASFAGDIGGFGGIDGDMIKRGGGVLTLDGVSLLDWTIEAGSLVSASDRFGGDIDIAAAAGFTFEQDQAGTYAGMISGSGDLALTGGGSVDLTGDSSGFAGMIDVTDATLIVNEGLGGSALIGDGALLAGSGTIGSGAGSTVTLASGSTLAPGNSIGTLTVDGDLVISAGSRFEVEVAPGGTDSDLVAVTGSATIDGGTVAHIGMSGTYDPSATFTILTAEGGLASGSAFDSVTSDFAFLDPTLGYGNTDVTLTLERNDISFGQIGRTPNQIAAAGGLDTLTFGNDLYDAVVQLDEASALAAFDQLSGEIHASAAAGLIEDSRHIRNAANDRIRAAFGDVGATQAPVLAYGSDGPVLAPATSDSGMAAWGTAFGSWGSTDSDGNAAALDRSTGGLLIGADALVTDGWRLGIMAGYSRSSFDADARASSADIDSYHLGLYGGTQIEAPGGDLALRGGLAYSWHDVDTSRAVGVPGFADSLTGNYSAGTFQVFGEAGYTIETEIARLEPFVNLAHVRHRTDSYGEDGGAAALSATSQTTATTFSTLGIRNETDIDLGAAQGRLNGTLGWRHAFGDVTPTTTHALAGSDAFTVAGSPIARDALVLEAGFDLDITDQATLGLSYQGQIASDSRDHGLNLRLGVRF